MQKQTLSQIILKVLKSNRKWFWAGQLEDAVHRQSIHKSSTVSRMARMLVNEGLLENTYRKINGRGHAFVMYRYKTKKI